MILKKGVANWFCAKYQWE